MTSKFRVISTYALLWIGVLIFTLPFLYMIIASTQNNAMILSIPPSFEFGGYARENMQVLNERFNFYRAFVNTIIITAVGTLFGTMFTTMAGYAFAKYRFSQKENVFKLLLFTTMIPQFATVIPLYLIFAHFGMLNTYAALILPGLASAASVFMMRQYLYAIPDEIIESARIDGASEMRIFYKIAVPMSVPAIVTGALTIFVGYWNAYLWPLISTTSEDMYTVSLVIRNMGLITDDLQYGVRYMGLVIAIIPIIIFYIVVQTRIKDNDLSSAIK